MRNPGYRPDFPATTFAAMTLLVLARPSLIAGADEAIIVPANVVFDRIFDETVRASEPLMQRSESGDATDEGRALQKTGDADRFARLLSWVLPGDGHQSLRMTADFAPPWEKPGSEFLLSGSTPQTPTGGAFTPVLDQLNSSAVELIQAAIRLKRLPELHDRVARWRPVSLEEQRAQAGFLALLAIAEQDFVAADHQIRSLMSLFRAAFGPRVVRDPELIVVCVGASQPQLRDIVREFTSVLCEESRRAGAGWNEIRKRYISALNFQLQVSDETQTLPGGQRPEIINSSAETDQSWRGMAGRWIPVSRVTARSRGEGYPTARWQVGSDQVRHLAGHDQDYLYYQIPLTGTFRVEADLTTFDYRDVHVGYGGIWASANYDRRHFLTGHFRSDQPPAPLDPPLTRMLSTQRVRMDVGNGWRTTWINGREIFRIHQSASDPWLSIHSWWFTSGIVRNMRITGTPEIPEEIHILEQPDLPGWLPYYGETVGGEGADWSLISSASWSPPALRSVQPVQTPVLLHGQRVLQGRHRPELAGTSCESLLQYHRPLVEDGTIEYEFWYEPQRATVHPALGRTVYLLNASGAAIHQITDGAFERSDTRPDNQTVYRNGPDRPGVLPLIAQQWNQVALTVSGNQLTLRLNQQLVCEQEIDAANPRKFGLFYYSDQSEARVRNLRWRGAWPREFPSGQSQRLIEPAADQQPPETSALPIVMQHDFRQRLPREIFGVGGGHWTEDFHQRETGLEVKRSGGHYTYYSILPPVTIRGDFDISASFEQLESTVEPGGESSVHLVVVLDDARSTECLLFRKRYWIRGGDQEQLIQPAMFEKRENETQYSFFDAPAEESTAGTLRMVRHERVLWYLYAEQDSTTFRVIHRQDVSDADAAVRLVVGHHLQGTSTVIWKSFQVRAESMDGLPAAPLKTLKQLDNERDRLRDKRMIRFASGPPVAETVSFDNLFQISGAMNPVVHDEQGLLLDVPGAQNWQAGGLYSQFGLSGDFDVAVSMDVLHLEPSALHDESTVLLQTEFPDDQQRMAEVKYSIHADGYRQAETQLRRMQKSGKFLYQELQTWPSSTIAQLRLARRGSLVYHIFQASEDSPAQILGVVEYGRDPVPRGLLRSIIHTGGDNRRTKVLYKSMSVFAEAID